MTIFSDYLVWPEDADSEIKLESQKTLRSKKTI